MFLISEPLNGGKIQGDERDDDAAKTRQGEGGGPRVARLATCERV